MTTNETHENYVSLEASKMLKEAGFDWKCHSCYSNGEFKEFSFSSYFEVVIMDFNSAPEYMEQYSAPTLSVVQRWLRNVKHVFVCIIPEIKDYNATWNFYIYNEQGLFYENEDCFSTYEEAQEAGIKNCLTIILSNKRKKRK